MPISINGAFNQLPSINTDVANKRAQQISSGQRINSAADDPAGLAISTRMGAQVDGFSVAMRNAGDGISYTQLGSGALSQLSDNLQRIRELSLQSANGTLNDTDRAALQKEADQLTAASNDILGKTNFNGVSLFNTDESKVFQTGSNAGDQITVEGVNLQQQLDDLGLNTLDISSQSGATDALKVIDDSLSAISARDAEFGAVANRFEANISQSETSRLNTAEARSRIADTDIASAAASLTTERIRNQAQIAVRAQANASAQNVLRLLS